MDTEHFAPYLSMDCLVLVVPESLGSDLPVVFLCNRRGETEGLLMTYVILPTEDVTQQMIDDCIQTSIETLRKSLDGDLAVLKYSGTKPASLGERTDLTHAEILVEMAGPLWNDPDEE